MSRHANPLFGTDVGVLHEAFRDYPNRPDFELPAHSERFDSDHAMRAAAAGIIAECWAIRGSGGRVRQFCEGRLLTVKHVTRERSRKLRKKLIEARRAHGLKCDICGVSHDHLPEDIVDAAFEAHHVISVAEAGERKTKVADLALLDATCHRLVHRIIAHGRAWVGIDEARRQLNRPHLSQQ